MPKTGHSRTEHGPEPWNSRCVHRSDRDAVITVFPADDLEFVRLALAVPEEPCCLDGAIVGITAARGKKEMIDRRVTELGEPFRQLNRWNIGMADIRGRESQLFH